MRRNCPRKDETKGILLHHRNKAGGRRRDQQLIRRCCDTSVRDGRSVMPLHLVCGTNKPKSTCPTKRTDNATTTRWSWAWSTIATGAGAFAGRAGADSQVQPEGTFAAETLYGVCTVQQQQAGAHPSSAADTMLGPVARNTKRASSMREACQRQVSRVSRLMMPAYQGSGNSASALHTFSTLGNKRE